MQNKYLAMTPPMGWNSWNTFTWNINEALVCGAADALCESGLRDKGYEYIVVDDCWSLKQRDENGRLVADPEKFPNGMKAVADYVHSKGLKVGMYSGRDIVLSACNWGHEDVHSWIRGSGAQLFRSTGDIQDNWQSVKSLFLSQLDKTAFSGPYCHNDIDMLVVGMHGSSNNEFIGALGACTDIEYRTHFALWAIMGSPLMIGCDVRSMSAATLETLGNEDLIRINQDIECRGPYCIRQWNNPENVMALVKPLSDGTLAICFVNLGDVKSEMSLQFWDMGIPYAANRGLEFYNCYTKENEGKFAERYVAVVEPHDSMVFIAKPVKLR